MNKRMAVLVGVLIVGAVVAFIAMRGYPPTGNTSGAIGAAQRYTGQPMSDTDVQLSAADAQAFLQSDLFHKMATNPAFRQEVKNGDIGKLYGTPAFARLLEGNHAFADLLVRGDFVKALQDQHMESLLRDPAMAHVIADPAFGRLLEDGGFRDLIGNRALVIGRLAHLPTGGANYAKGEADAAHGAVDANKQMTDAAHGAVDANKQMTNAAHGAVDANKQMTDAAHGAVDANKQMTDAAHGAVDANKEMTDAAHGAVDANKQMMEAGKVTDANQGAVEAGRTTVDQLRIDPARYKGDQQKIEQAQAELQRLSNNDSFRGLVGSDGFARLITSADAAAIVKDAKIVDALRAPEYANLIANDQSRADVQAVMTSDAFRGALNSASFTDMLKIDGMRDFLVSDGFRGTAAHYSADLAQVVDGYKLSE